MGARAPPRVSTSAAIAPRANATAPPAHTQRVADRVQQRTRDHHPEPLSVYVALMTSVSARPRT